ncbi:MAG: glycosyltransferase family 2 protein [Clostridia bacterium]|nr:glycosyltransferase family 2 protein [Clostridia bacterium]
MKISIIIPVYNTEKYLRKCLDSVINQNYNNYEIIIVNDESTDGSQKIIDEYEKRYSQKIKAFFKKNEGISEARNFGVSKARGDYITFVDSDDYIDCNMLSKMSEKAEEKNFDIVLSNLKYVYPKKEVVVSSGIKKDIFGKELKGEIINILPAMCGKLIKKEMFEDLKFKKNIWFEDLEIYFRMYTKIKSVGVIDKAYYNYIQRINSITYTYNEKLYDLINNWEDIIDFYIKENIFNEYKEELEYSYVRYAFATFIKRLAKSKDKEKFNIGVIYAIEKVKLVFPNYKRNKYINRKGLKNLYLKFFNKSIAKIIYALEKNKLN